MSDSLELHLSSEYVRRGRAAELHARRGGGAVPLQRIRQGAYVDARAWSTAKPETRMRTRGRAFTRAAKTPPVFAGLSAAAEWGLPLWRADESRVHVLDAGRNPARSRADVVSHRGPLPDGDLTVRGGLLMTSLSRTVFDIVRTETLEQAITVCDAALRKVAWRGVGDYDEVAAEQFRDELRRRIDAAPGARGIRQARFVVTFADGRAQLPGESVSRLWMQRLGVPEPELQREVRLASGRRAYPDFAWPALRRFGEFDGDGKYVDPGLTSGRSVRDILRAQRARESEVVAATGWAPVRWGTERLTTRPVFERFLRASPPALPPSATRPGLRHARAARRLFQFHIPVRALRARDHCQGSA